MCRVLNRDRGHGPVSSVALAIGVFMGVVSCDGTVITTPEIPPDTSGDILSPETTTDVTPPTDVADGADTTDVTPTDTTDVTPTDTTDVTPTDTTDVTPTDTTDVTPTDTTDVTDVTDVIVDPCAPNPCTAPPTGCDGTVLEVYASPGACTFDTQVRCAYTLSSSTDCAASGRVCSESAKACVFPDLAVILESTSPAANALDFDAGAPIVLTFNQPMDGATLTAQTTAGACTGNIQLSTDDFVTCRAFSTATATLSDGGRVATLTPAPPLTWGLSYRMRVGAAVAGGNGRTLGTAAIVPFSTGPVTACGGPRVVISQIYGGGGDSPGVFTHDFIELKNRTARPINLTGWSLHYGSSTGTAFANRLNLTGVIPPGGYWLVQAGTNGSNNPPLPTPDQTTGTNLGATNGKVALVVGTATIDTSCPPADRTIDFIGYGNANCSETTSALAAAIPTAVHRRIAGCADSGVNRDDTLIAPPRPRNSSSPAAFCACPDDAVANGTGGLEADYCKLQWPPSILVDHGGLVPDIYGRIYEAGVTDTATGPAAQVRAQVGWGLASADPRDQTGWVFYAAPFNVDVGNDDEYAGSFPVPVTVPPALQSFAYTYRMSLDGGASWTYCDLDGAGSNPGLSFDPTKLGVLTVGDDPCDPNPCTTPSTTPFCVGEVVTTLGTPGSCTVVGTAPSCAYPDVAGTDCAALGDRCANGRCVECVESNDCEGALEVCVDNLCVESNPCAPNPCTAPPPPTCDGDVLVTSPNPGRCRVIGEGHSCDYESDQVRTTCPVGCSGGACLTPGFSVTASIPADATTGVDVSAPLVLDTSSAIDPATVTVQAALGPCTGSVQISFDNFASCIGIASTGLSNGNRRLTITPARDLSHGLTFALRATTALRSSASVALETAFTATFSTSAPTACGGAVVVIGQVYGGGGNSGAPLTHDFVVLRNRTTRPITLDGWSLQYNSATGTLWTAGNSLALRGIIPAGGHFLVQLGAGSGNGVALPTPDQTAGIAMSASTGKLALVTGTAVLAQNECPEPSRIIDFVAYGADASNCSSHGRTGVLSNTTAAHRDVAGCVDTNANATDFFVGAPSPLNSSAPASFCACATDGVANETGLGTEADFCALQHPPRIGVAAGAETPPIYGRIFEAGKTDTTTGGPAPGIIAQLGYGRLATSPLTQQSWVFVPATFNVETGLGNNDDEYRATLRAPIAPNLTSYAYTYRFSLDDGASWTYCDLDGAGSNGAFELNADKLGLLTIGGTACLPNPCTTPDPDFCDGDLVRRYTSPGTCTIVGGEASCTYASAPLTNCASTGDRCLGGVCVDCVGDGDCALPFERCSSNACIAQCTDDALVGNQSAATAHLVTGDFSQAGLVVCPGTSDWFEFQANAGGTIAVSMTHSARSNLDLRLVDALGLELATAATTNLTETLSYSVPTSGTYRLQVQDSGGFGATYSLQIGMSGNPCQPNPCNEVRAPFCEGTVRVVPASPGVCSGNAVCDYDTTATRTTCEFGCSGGSCNPPPALVLVTSLPDDGATNVPIDEVFELVFDRALDPSTLVVQTATGPCVGSLQVSFDGFGTCIGLNHQLLNDDTRILFSAIPLFAYAVDYQLRLTSELRSVLGAGLAAPITLSFSTESATRCGQPRALLSQVFTGGGEAGAAFSHDFVEIKNLSPDSLVLDGWSLQIATGTGTGRSIGVIPLRGTLAPAGIFLVQLASAGAQGAALPSPDQSASTPLGPGQGVMLVSSVSATHGAACATGGKVLDLLAFGATDCTPTSPLPALATSQALKRDVAGCKVSGDPTLDFIRGAPSPRPVDAQHPTCADCTHRVANDTEDPTLVNLELDFCNLQWPPSVAVGPGADTALIFGRVYQAGLTNTTSGQAPGIRAELGFGPYESDPRTQQSWAFVSAEFNIEAGNDDEYKAKLTAPMRGDLASYAYAYRMSLDGGATWTYCDKNGAGRNPGLVFTSNELGRMVVGAECTRDTECPVDVTCNTETWRCGSGPVEVVLYTQNFNGLPGNEVANTDNFNQADFDSRLGGWVLRNNNGRRGVHNGGSGTGAIYSFGSTGAPDRALGGVASGSTGTQTQYWGFCYTNLGPGPVFDIKLDYIGEQWRNGGNTTAQKLTFAWSTVPEVTSNLAGKINSADAGDWTALAALDFTSPIHTSTAGALDGNAVANRTALTHTWTVNLAADATICFRWTDINDDGNDHGLAVDDLVLRGTR